MKIFLIILILFSAQSRAQENLSTPQKVYQLNYSLELPLTGALFGLNFLGLATLGDKGTLSVAEVKGLNKNDIWAFDRSAVKQSYPAPANIYTLSDIGLWTTYAAPALLFFDDEIRKDWLDITLLYFETQAINLNIYLYGGPAFTERVRPIVYYEEASIELKTREEMMDSFFSGHVSMTAGASFFIAKVFTDYHPELGAEKWLWYAGALIPPAFVGYCRYRGLMHFPSDILLGFAIGATAGILTPHLHKVAREENTDLSVLPFFGKYSGLKASLRF